MQKVALHVYEDQGGCAGMEGGCVWEGVGSGAEDLCGHCWRDIFVFRTLESEIVALLFLALLNSF